MEKTLYADLVAAGCLIDSHESDLYTKDTPDARAIFKAHRVQAVPFTNQQNGETWIEAPFCFAPFWERKARLTA